MLEEFVYKNHMNEELRFGEGGIYANSNDLHDFAWSTTSKNNRITGFNRGIVAKTVPVVIKCISEEEGTRIRNMLFEYAEKDVLSMQYGKISIGDYYLKCYVTDSKKTDYLADKSLMKVSLGISTDLPYWIKETKNIFRPLKESKTGKNLDFNFDFPFDFYNGMSNMTLLNEAITDADFEMIVYGKCENPEIMIDGQKYIVHCQLGSGEYLVINSLTKKIYKVKNDGEKVNQYHLQDTDWYIFQKISSGKHTVSWSGLFGFDITLFERRSEPKWT